MDTTHPRFALLAQGRLYLDGGGSVRELKSHFGERIRERAVAMHERNAWKTSGTGARFMGTWAMRDQEDPAAMPIEVSSVASGSAPGELLYCLETPEICGLLKLEQQGAEENRLWHSNSRRVRDLALHAGSNRIVCAVAHDDGTAGIAVMQSDGSRLSIATEGDSVDLAPRWIPGKDDLVVFQSAGVGRNRDGFPVGLGPFHIQQLTLTSGELQTIADSPEHDLLAPQYDAEGRLYFIRRPYRPGHWRPWWATLLDVVLLPWRLLYAVFQFFNFFSMRYTGQPLSADGGSARKAMDAQRMVLWGNVIDARRAMRKARPEEAPDLVPSSWELIRREPDGTESVLARGVLSFDLCRDGTILYLNGSAVLSRAPDGKVDKVARHNCIEQVIALDQ
jgi:hypothetical protein